MEDVFFWWEDFKVKVAGTAEAVKKAGWSHVPQELAKSKGNLRSIRVVQVGERF